MPRRLPFEYLDKACFAGSYAPWASFAPTWRLSVKGALSDAVLRQATSWLAARYPVIAARAVPLDGTLETARRLAWELDERPDLDRLLKVVDLRAATLEQRAASEQLLADNFIDLERDYPFLLTWVRRGEGEGALFLQQQHALADGRAFLGLCRDLVGFLDAAARGASEPPPPLAPFARLPELEVVPDRGLRRAASFLQGMASSVLGLLGDALRPLHPLRCNLGADYTGKNRTHFLTLPASRFEGWREPRKRLGLSSNALFSAALVTALGRWSVRHGVHPGRTRLLLPVDVRPRDRAFDSFANHLSALLLRFDLARPPPLLELAAKVASQSARQLASRLPLKRLLFETAAATLMPVGAMRRLVFQKRALFACYSFSNLIGLGVPGAGADGRWRGQGFEVDSLRVTTPCTPPQGANTTVVRYGESLCFNFNYKDSVLEPALVEDLSASFEQALFETGAALAR
ncbi:MAG: WS/DGAT/MGAT family O-acyltransferase [Myxococcaceae bacterium]